ncbi:type II toxin-antitoxin system VapC family toxin [Sphingomonas sp. NIC1]|uniref:type II toxin-antitoxin system VapC family toxin n=1 Tax=Sphingomonas sp. NIC1 TaxID=1961362 RepID=UPI0007C0CC37|nr:type II toxin-antitoxin system VapC family toxin [Sphingomonas sp. NIC1]ANC87661.1 twitching motility protein PilT [Sphingomonas sp. NIC1]
MTEARVQPRYLLDSNICIYLLEGLSATARTRAEQCALGEIATSAIAYAEVLRGVDPADDRAMAAARAFFDVCTVLPFEGMAAEAYQHVPFRRARFDRLIGAHALALGLTVVTNNETDYNDIPGLMVENWVQ